MDREPEVPAGVQCKRDDWFGGETTYGGEWRSCKIPALFIWHKETVTSSAKVEWSYRIIPLNCWPGRNCSPKCLAASSKRTEIGKSSPWTLEMDEKHDHFEARPNPFWPENPRTSSGMSSGAVEPSLPEPMFGARNWSCYDCYEHPEMAL